VSPAGGPATPDGEDDLADVPFDGPETVAEQRLLASFGRQARTVNLGRVLRLLALLDLSDAGALDERGRGEAENLAHQVVGSAGTFGFPAASTDAAVIEGYFAVPGDDGPGPDARLVRRTLERLRAVFEDPAQR
jgi:hypothetical protein